MGDGADVVSITSESDGGTNTPDYSSTSQRNSNNVTTTTGSNPVSALRSKRKKRQRTSKRVRFSKHGSSNEEEDDEDYVIVEKDGGGGVDSTKYYTNDPRHTSFSTYPLIYSVITSMFLKLYMFAGYRSTDFEVHRNWLAITWSLPISRWYYESTSEWTLDYPPFFAYMEYLFSGIARLIDKDMVKITNNEYSSWSTIIFQRTSVILTELILAFSLQKYIDLTPRGIQQASFVSGLSIILSPYLFILDHIHFQYNGAMYGLLIYSLVLARQGELFLSGIVFAILLCFKHIYLYLAPAYFVYLLRAYCMPKRLAIGFGLFRWGRLINLSIGVLTVFSIAFGPFIYLEQIPQLLSRLFPFSRGLTHAYWAPNFWSLYLFTDRILIFILKIFRAHHQQQQELSSIGGGGATRGLIGDSNTAILPTISVNFTIFLTLITQIPGLIYLFMKPNFNRFLGSLTICGFSSFLFGWHVHEKAILSVIIPFSMLALRDRRYFLAYIPLVCAGTISLFPLIYTIEEFPIMVIYSFVWSASFFTWSNYIVPVPKSKRIFLLDRLSGLYIIGLIPIIFLPYFFYRFNLGLKFQFLPLMITSVYCSIGIFASFLGFSWLYFFGHL